MNKIALTAMCVGALGLVACGGSSGGDTPDTGIVSFTDANTTGGADGGGGAKCNPVTNTGCDPTFKCTVITDAASGLSVTDCAPDGTVDLGGTCMAVAGEGYDDCKAKSLCSGGTCREICGSAPNTCGGGDACSQYGGLFDDVEGAGLCSASCDPVTQDCTDTAQGCFIVLQTGVATCEGANDAGTAGVECSGPADSPTACWVNGCAKGNLPFLAGATGGRALCTPFCTPIDTDSTNWQANKMGDPNGVTCPVIWGGGVDQNNISCRFLGSIYSNVTAGPTVGVCMDFTIDYFADTNSVELGSCEFQTPGINEGAKDDFHVPAGGGGTPGPNRWVPGCLLSPQAATGSSSDRSKLPKFPGDVSLLNEVIRANQ